MKTQPFFIFSALIVLSLAINFCILFRQGYPIPRVHDEFANLLTAETFAQGHLTNPSHPMWLHFQSTHILYEPTYTGPYPVVPILFLALGIKLGHPILGVYFCNALLYAALAWMLFANKPLKWSMIGALIGLLQTGCFIYWTQSYWGGAATALAGCLLFGAFRRLLKKVTVKRALIYGLSLVMLANTRPFEGFLTAIPPSLILGLKILRGQNVLIWRKKFFLSCAFVLLVGAFLMMHYHKAVTGDPLRFPKDLEASQQTAVPFFIWEPLRPDIHFEHLIMKNYEEQFHKSSYLAKRTLKGTWDSLTNAFAGDFFRINLHPALWIPLLFGILLALRQRVFLTEFMTLLLVLLIAPFLVSFEWQPHYAASVMPLLILFAVHGFEKIYTFKLDRVHVGKALLIYYFLFVIPIRFVDAWRVFPATQRADLWPEWRQQIIKTLENRPGSHLILVRYPSTHNVNEEYVYNGPNIDHQKVIWAKDMGLEKNQELFDYYKRRNIWLLDTSPDKPSLHAYIEER